MLEKKGLVLCVDDEPSILRSLGWLLQKEFTVMTAPSGQDGLELVKKHDFDVVISDQRMPGMMGAEFLREVRKISPRSMRILLTGYSDLQAILRSVNESEVFRFINKPWKINELPLVVAEAAHIAKTHPVPEGAGDPPGPAPSEQAVESVLLIDDEPAIADLLKQELGAGFNVIHARNLAEAVTSLSEENIGIILSDTTVGDTDATGMLRMLKQQHPTIVTVVYTGETDAGDVVDLINQGQIFRFIPKPVNPNILAQAMNAASRKRYQLKMNPSIAKRHAVEDTSHATKQAVAETVTRVAKTTAGSGEAGGSLLQRISGGFRRLFGG